MILVHGSTLGGNRSNETDRQITDISGNGNDLTPYNFAWTRESGWNQGSIHSDGIDDNLISNIKSLQKNNVSDQVDKFRLFCFPDYTSNYSAGNLHEYILFSTELTDDQILNNKKLITQRNGIEDHVNFTAIASGKKFPIYYTINNSKTPIFFKNALSNGYFAKVHIRKFLGFKEALTAEQTKLVIDKYFK